ncbi:hypothetical protein ACFQVA_36730 [Actinomadura keratinilytica]
MRIRAVYQAELAALQDIERAAGVRFREIGMAEIAEDEPPPVAELARYAWSGLARVAADGEDRPVAYLVAERVDGSLHVEQVTVRPESARRVPGGPCWITRPGGPGARGPRR